MEGDREMNDILLGTIIGGTIGVAGSAVVAWIQEHYSQKRQLRQMQCDRDMELIRRIVEARAKYLDPLSSCLGKLQTCLSDFQDRLFEVIIPYASGTKQGERVVRIGAEEKSVVIRRLGSVNSAMEEVVTARTRVEEAAFNARDMSLREILKAVVFTGYDLGQAYYRMREAIVKSEDGESLVYDAEQVIGPMKCVYVRISSAHKRIESLLAGVDAGDE